MNDNLSHLKHFHHIELQPYRMNEQESIKLLPPMITQQSLSLLHQNCQSLSKHYDEFSHFILSIHVQFSVNAVSELWCNNLIDFSHLDTIEGYKLYPNPRKRKIGGGVAFYIRDNLEFDFLDITITNVDSLWIEIKTKKGTEIFGVIYRFCVIVLQRARTNSIEV
eukprot:Lithocolla_globosa_v1_NODE_4971_length_1326_cov_6.886703.p1 type:complete len:165 gc:universal NODE_4971_length_1326_cov_6.886703:73-567(+)